MKREKTISSRVCIQGLPAQTEAALAQLLTSGCCLPPAQVSNFERWWRGNGSRKNSLECTVTLPAGMLDGQRVREWWPTVIRRLQEDCGVAALATPWEENEDI